MADRIRKILAALVLSDDLGGFIAGSPPGWRIHPLTGDRKGVWSVSASGNWRITFKESKGMLEELNLEDYH